MRLVPLMLSASIGCSHPAGPPPPRMAAQSGDAGADPPPAYHAYPEIPPDELPVAAEACHALPAPPAPPKATRIASGPPVTNHIPPEVIMRPMRARTSCLRQCWESSPAYRAAARGRVSVRFVVDGDGYVRKSTVRDVDGLDESVGECVAKQLLGMEFPAPVDGPVTVIYPFRFGSP